MRAQISPINALVRGAAWLVLALLVALAVTLPGLRVLWRLVSLALIAVVALALARSGSGKVQRLATLAFPVAVFLASAAFQQEHAQDE